MMKDASSCVLVFLKEPEAGKVKSRLARSLGVDLAKDLYTCFVEDLLATVSGTCIHTLLCYTPEEAAARIEKWLGPDYPLLAQQGQDLGARMDHAFRHVFGLGCRRAVLVGSDMPDLPRERITDAFEALRTHPVVLGPTPDGGYFLIGFNASMYLPNLFEGVTWGSSEVLETTLARLDRMQIRARLLESWADIDTREDLLAFSERTQRFPHIAPRTVSCLKARFPNGLPAKAPP